VNLPTLEVGTELILCATQKGPTWIFSSYGYPLIYWAFVQVKLEVDVVPQYDIFLPQNRQ